MYSMLILDVFVCKIINLDPGSPQLEIFPTTLNPEKKRGM